MVSTSAVVRIWLEHNGPAPLGKIAEDTGLPLTSVRSHLETNSTRDDDGNWVDMYAWYLKPIEAHGVRHWHLTGLEQA